LINDLTAIEGDFILELHDYHVIRSQPIYAGTTFLLENIPARMHLVVATREDPALPLARFRVKGPLLEIKAEYLRFIGEEAAGVLKSLQGPELSAVYC